MTICHKGKKTLSVDRHALDAHLRHGDHLGACGDDDGEDGDDEEPTTTSTTSTTSPGTTTTTLETATSLSDERVVLCHRGKKTKSVKAHRVEKHLGHGDTLGACS